MKKSVNIGTRGSRLALWQANNLKDLLKEIGLESELVIINTQGDQIQDLPLAKLEGKGFFTKEIEEALYADTIDIAVHSLKDLPTENTSGLVIAGLSKRANPEDWVIMRKNAVSPEAVFDFKEGAIVGTSSARRKASLIHYRPDVKIKDIRGNVPTRIKKLADGNFDAIVLAAAGVSRLDIDLSEFHVVKMHPQEFVPAPGQGVIAYQCRKEDKKIRRILNQIHQKEVAKVTNIERGVLKALDGGCHLPLGVYCKLDHLGHYHVSCCFAESWNAPLVQFDISQSTTVQLVEKIIEKLN